MRTSRSSAALAQGPSTINPQPSHTLHEIPPPKPLILLPDSTPELIRDIIECAIENGLGQVEEVKQRKEALRRSNNESGPDTSDSSRLSLMGIRSAFKKTKDLIVSKPDSSTNGKSKHRGLSYFSRRNEDSYVINPLLDFQTSLTPRNSQCIGCLENVKRPIRSPCNHFYCDMCFNKLILAAVQNPIQWPPKCCRNTIPERSIEKYASTDAICRWRRKKEEMDTPGDQRVYCAVKDEKTGELCNEWVGVSTNDIAAEGTCPKGHKMCMCCRGPAHGIAGRCPGKYKVDPGEEEQVLRQLAAEEVWQRCPGCKAYIEHTGGCVTMQWYVCVLFLLYLVTLFNISR